MTTRYTTSDFHTEIVDAVGDPWRTLLAGLGAGDVEGLIGRATTSWAALIRAQRPTWIDVATRLVARAFPTGTIGEDDRARLESAAVRWLEAYGVKLLETHIAEPARHAAAAAADPIETAREVLGRAAERIGLVEHPLLQRMLAVGAARRIGLGRKALSEGIDPDARYVIVTRPDACPTCLAIAYRGNKLRVFRIRDALAQFDAFLDFLDENDGDEAVLEAVERVPFPRLEEVEDLSARALTALGYNVPPFHGSTCRCQIALVRRS